MDVTTTGKAFLIFKRDGYLSLDNQTNASVAGILQGTGRNLVDVLNVYLIPAIIIVGLAGNTAAFVVLMVTPRLFCQSSNLYLAFLAMVDNLSLVFVATVWFGWVGVNFFHTNGWCQTINYLSSVCSSLSAWTVIGFTCERWVTIFHPLKRQVICTRKKAATILTSLSLASLTFYSFTLFVYKVKKFPNGREVCLMVHKSQLFSKVAFGLDTLLNVILPLIIIITMNFGIAIKIWLYTRRNSKTQCLVKSSGPRADSIKDVQIPLENTKAKSLLMPTRRTLERNRLRTEAANEPYEVTIHSVMFAQPTEGSVSSRRNQHPEERLRAMRAGWTKDLNPEPANSGSARKAKKRFSMRMSARSLDETALAKVRLYRGGTHNGDNSNLLDRIGSGNGQALSMRLNFSRVDSYTSDDNSRRQNGQKGSGDQHNSGQTRSWRVLTRKQHTQVRITWALLSISTFFILFNLPSYAFRIHSFFSSTAARQNIASLFVQFLHFSNFSSRFFLYSACSRNFRYALSRLACRRKPRRDIDLERRLERKKNLF